MVDGWTEENGVQTKDCARRCGSAGYAAPMSVCAYRCGLPLWSNGRSGGLGETTLERLENGYAFRMHCCPLVSLVAAVAPHHRPTNVQAQRPLFDAQDSWVSALPGVEKDSARYATRVASRFFFSGLPGIRALAS